MDEHFEKITLFLRHKSRLSFTGHKRTILRRRLQARIEQLDLPDYSSYWSFLLAHPEEESHLYELATTNETSFFRNAAQFGYLKEFICPGLDSHSGKIRILSAGCSTGEEPYSIAMTMMDALGSRAENRVEIVAGDIHESCLRSARAGFFENDRLDRLPPGYRERFMLSSADGATVLDSVKKCIRFMRLNLDDLMKPEQDIWGPWSGSYDIVFCRNVMIYFASDCQQVLVDALHRILLPGGYLFTGDAEPLHLFRHEFRPVATSGCLIYQKNGETYT